MLAQDKLYLKLNHNDNPRSPEPNNHPPNHTCSLKRNLKDTIVVANTCGTYMFNLHNGIPVKEFHGNK